MSEILVNTIKKADGTGGLTVPTTAGNIVTTGGATFTGAVNMGANNISFSNGNGIDFSASEGSGASSSILDDYEEGTWTATANQGSVTSTGGIYVKVGKMVHVKVKLDSFTDRTDPGYLSIGGLPFARQDASQVASSGIVYRYISGNALTGVFFQGSNEIVFYKHANGDWDTLSNNELNNSGSEIYFALTYYTSA